jgi:integrase
MSFRMVTPRSLKSGSIKVRKGIPKDVRAEYQRLYGPGREATLTLPGGTRPHDAKIRISEWTAEVESRIATIRAARKGEGQSLSQRQAFALAGEWYVWYVGRHEENPGTPEHWRTMWDVLILELESHVSPEVLEKPWKNLEWTRDSAVRAGIRAVVADEAKTAQFLAGRGVVLTNETQALFLDCVLDEFIAAILRLERLAGGDYEPDERPAQFPRYDGQRTVRQGTTVTPWALFDAWATATRPAQSTVDRWRAVFIDLDKRFASAGDITREEARDWTRKLVTPQRGPRTVNDIWVTAARTVFGWAVGEQMISANPFEGVRVTQPRKIHLRETQAFTPVEAATILRASSAIGEPRTAFEGALRWVPWLCGYSGARAGEITQLRGTDIEKEDGIYRMKLTPEAGTMKTKKPRRVPLHEHVIEQGFLDFVRSRGNGPLFYEASGETGSSDQLKPKRPRSVVVRNKIAAWVRKQGITDRELSPTHGWRHTFKQIAARAGIDARMSDYITGHSLRTIGDRYGAPTLKDLAAALEKFPRYALLDP